MKNKITSALIIGVFLASSAGAAIAAGGENFIKSWDDNGDSAVSLEEIKLKRESIFYSFDSDEDGYLSAEEYAYFDEARANDQADKGAGQNQGGNKGADLMTLEANDLDGDGKVSREEFLENANVFFTGKDSNGDGLITTADFGNYAQ